MKIRPETTIDHNAVYAVHTAAFETVAEADLVNALRDSARPLVSLVAEADAGGVVGHVLFSPVTLRDNLGPAMMGLAPMAVVPTHQRRGIGSALVRRGLERCRQIGCRAVVVLGHPEYYPRFGFVPSTRFGIDSEYAVPEEVFMVIELVPGALDAYSGRVRYHAAFGDV